MTFSNGDPPLKPEMTIVSDELAPLKVPSMITGETTVMLPEKFPNRIHCPLTQTPLLPKGLGAVHTLPCVVLEVESVLDMAREEETLLDMREVEVELDNVEELGEMGIGPPTVTSTALLG